MSLDSLTHLTHKTSVLKNKGVTRNPWAVDLCPMWRRLEKFLYSLTMLDKNFIDYTFSIFSSGEKT